jgi:tetratricopeptide (TPR) repeat protein
VARALQAGERAPEEGQQRDKSVQELAEKARDYWQEALTRLNGILESGEGNTNAMNALQRVYALSGDFEQSLSWSQRLLERTAAERTAWQKLLQEKNLTDKEETLYRKNLRDAADLENDSHLFAATLLFRMQRYADAIAHLDRVVESSPELPQAYSLRGQMRARVGEYEAAIQDLDRYLALSDAPYESPDIQRAFELRAEAEKHARGK